jgi:hypothetical protein
VTKSLEKDFSERKKWHHNRANAIFMCYINELNDNIIVFQNYWQWKNKIDNIVCIVRLRHEDGSVFDTKEILISNHNEISIKKFFLVKNFIGSIDLEIISTSNIGFPFPAILCFYLNRNSISVVHSSGRILNSHENNEQTKFSESNFLCVLDDDFEPFVHVFSGSNAASDKGDVRLIFKDNNNVVLVDKLLQKVLIRPFQSKIIKITDICNKSELIKIYKKDFYLTVEVSISGIFGRFIVGNYNNKIDAYFVTHSFRRIDPDDSDISVKPDNADATSFLPIVCSGPLSVTATSYPTNSKANLILYERLSKLDNTLKKTEKERSIYTGGSNGSIFRTKVEGNIFSYLYTIDPTPSRMNVNYSYSLKNSCFPTDIATGFKSYVYPPKVSHWGEGVCLDRNFETYVFIRNCSHNFSETKAAHITFRLFNTVATYKEKMIIQPESAKCIKLSDLKVDLSDNLFFSWNIVSSQPTLETFWVSFNENNGVICGEHGF